MNHSPKLVKVDLLAESQRRSKSPTRRTPNAYKGILDFSFSNEDSPCMRASIKTKEKERVSKNLFGKVPQERKEIPIKYQDSLQSQKRSNSGRHNNDRLSPTKKTENRDSQLFKKSLDKLKKTFFSGVRNNRDQTVKTLKEIGKHAKYQTDTMKSRNHEEESPPQRKRNIPVQFVGFDPNSTKSWFKSSQTVQNQKIVESQVISSGGRYNPNKETADKGTYFNFEEQIKKDLKQSQNHVSALSNSPKISCKRPFEGYEDLELPVRQSIVESPPIGSSLGFDSINEIQIDVVCDIFEMCEKYNEGDRLTSPELIQLLKEFERLYFIRVIQQSEAGSSRARLKVFQSQFNELLRQFEVILKMIFYRKEACDIYDCLYYLKESQKLDRICSLFMGLKKMLLL